MAVIFLQSDCIAVPYLARDHVQWNVVGKLMADKCMPECMRRKPQNRLPGCLCFPANVRDGRGCIALIDKFPRRSREYPL